MSQLVKAVFGMSGAEPHFTGYHKPGDTCNGWEMPCAERAVLEEWAAKEGVDFEFFADGTLLVRNIEGLDLREAGNKSVDLTIEPEELDTEDGVKVLYDLRELDWTFSLADHPRQQTAKDEQVLIPDGDHGTSYKLRDGEDAVWVQVDNLTVRIERGPRRVWLSVFPAGKEDGRPLLETHQGEEDADPVIVVDDERERVCLVCGGEFRVDDAGHAHHYTDGKIDQEQDTDHAPYDVFED